MKIWLLDEERFVKLNNLPEITNPISFESGMIPTPDGLFSNEIFGMSVGDRRHRWAYIDLHHRFISPKAYITLKALNRNFEAIVFGTKKFKIADGLLIEDENGGTGTEWLYKNWEKIDFQKNESNKRSSRIDMIKNSKKDSIFFTKFAVIPAFYRDVNMQGNAGGHPKVPEVNDLYAQIIRNINIMQDATTFDIMINAVTGKTQNLLVDIYNLFKDKSTGKNGHLRKSVMGKSIDYCARIVITAVPYTYNTPEEQPIDYYNTGVPLSFCCAQLTPFIIYWVKNWFKTNVFDHKDQYPVLDKNGNRIYVKLDNPEIVFNDEYIDKQLTRWLVNPASRYGTIELPIKLNKNQNIQTPIYLRLNGYSYKNTTMAKQAYLTKSSEGKILIDRKLTWTDLFYMAAHDVSSDKHVVITRYPMLDYLGSYISRIHVLSTRQTIPMIINDQLYEYYPDINLSLPSGRIESGFIDSYKVCPLYLPGLDGDHDGDQITSKIIFSKEANEEAERIMMSKSNLIAIDGTSIRNIGNEGVQTLYTLTRFH